MMDESEGNAPQVDGSVEVEFSIEAEADARQEMPLPSNRALVASLIRRIEEATRAWSAGRKAWWDRSEDLSRWASSSISPSEQEYAEILREPIVADISAYELQEYFTRDEWITYYENLGQRDDTVRAWVKGARDFRLAQDKPLLRELLRTYPPNSDGITFLELADLAYEISRQHEQGRQILEAFRKRVLQAIDDSDVSDKSATITHTMHAVAAASVGDIHVHVQPPVINISNHIDTAPIAAAMQKPSARKSIPTSPGEPVPMGDVDTDVRTAAQKRGWLLKALLRTRHFDDDEFLSESTPMSLKELEIILTQRNNGDTPDGWSPRGMSAAFKVIFKVDKSHKYYESLVQRDPKKLLELLSDERHLGDAVEFSSHKVDAGEQSDNGRGRLESSRRSKSQRGEFTDDSH